MSAVFGGGPPCVPSKSMVDDGCYEGHITNSVPSSSVTELNRVVEDTAKYKAGNTCMTSFYGLNTCQAG